tara:strand:+ start:2300 stop:2671 length:372 start_codon:yes stop_codon:yes gene_type:complete
VLGDVDQGWSLVAQSGPEKGQIIPIQGTIEIGRALECEISSLEPALSRKHAELEIIDDNEMLKRDLGSVNCTYVNGEKVDEVTLKAGVIIQDPLPGESAMNQTVCRQMSVQYSRSTHVFIASM